MTQVRPIHTIQSEISYNHEVAPGVFELELVCPEIAHAVRPGQFVHVLISTDSSRILRRPFSVYRAEGESLALLYQVVGDGTRELSGLGSGDSVSVLGPLGRGWEVPAGAKRVLFVTGGLGAAPLAMLAQELEEAGIEMHVAMGAPSSVRLVGVDEYTAASCSINLATDDGSAGHHGFCTDVAASLLSQYDFDYVATCGPEPMQRIVADLAADADVACEVSLERRMACGVGACLSCVVATVSGVKRSCIDGPVFDAAEVIWDA